MKDGKEVKRYWVALGPAPMGHKQRKGISARRKARHPGLQEEQLRLLQGDPHQLPEPGRHQACQRAGVNPGGMIMIHGQRNSLGSQVQPSNWTNGCIAVLNHEMDGSGTPSSRYPIIIEP